MNYQQQAQGRVIEKATPSESFLPYAQVGTSLVVLTIKPMSESDQLERLVKISSRI